MDKVPDKRNPGTKLGPYRKGDLNDKIGICRYNGQSRSFGAFGVWDDHDLAEFS